MKTAIEQVRVKPVVRTVRGRRGGVMLMCPVGHLLAFVPRTEWVGSYAEARLGDPNYTRPCAGCNPHNGAAEGH